MKQGFDHRADNKNTVSLAFNTGMDQRIDFGTKLDPKGAMRGKDIQPETFKSLDND